MTDIALLGTTIAGLAASFLAFNAVNNTTNNNNNTTNNSGSSGSGTVGNNTNNSIGSGSGGSGTSGSSSGSGSSGSGNTSSTQITVLSIDGDAVNNIRQIGFEKGILAFQKAGSSYDSLEYRHNLLTELKKFIVSEAFGLPSFSNFTFSNESSLLQGDLGAFHIFVNKIIYELKLVIY